jgi:hypothetical protein
MRVAFALLAFAIILMILPSCKNGEDGKNEAINENADVSKEAETEAPNYLDILPEMDFGGYAFKIFAQEPDMFPQFPGEEETGEPLNDALFRRNRALEDRLGITFENIPIADRGALRETLNRSVRSQDMAYDMIITSMADGLNTLAPSGALYDMNSLGYLSLAELWWCKSMYETMQVNGKIFYNTGPLTPIFYYTPIVCAYNKNKAADLDIGDVNQLVLNNEWTADKFVELIKNKNRDVDGDGMMTMEDFYGLATGDGNCGAALFTAFNQKITVRDDEKYFRLAFEDENTVNMVQKCAEILFEPSSTNNGAMDCYGSVAGFASEIPLFVDGHALFTIITMNNVINFYRAMDDDYGIVPLPKLDSAQAQYVSYGNPWGPAGIAVPNYCDNPERTGLIMETMAYSSYESIRPAMYDIIIQQKIARDESSQKMLDIVYSNFYFDLNVIHNFGDSSIFLRDCLSGFRTDFVSGYEKIKDKAEAAIDKLVEAYLSIE